jgi:trimeric autotransporter adhesin
MKKITLLMSFIACVVFAQAQLLVNENFNYTAGTGLVGQGTGVTGQGAWAVLGTTVTFPQTVTAPGTPAVTYQGYPSSGVGNECSVGSTGQDIALQFTPQTSGTVYFSVLVNLSAAQATGDYFMNVGEPSSTTFYFGRLFAKLDGTNVAFGILNSSGTGSATTWSTSTYSLNTTYLIVVKVSTTTGASALAINPSLTTEPTTEWILNATSATVPTVAGLGEINIRQGSSSTAPTLKLDGIHVATSYNGLFGLTGFSSPKADALNVFLNGSTLTVNNAANGSTVDIYSSVGAKVQTSKLENNTIQLNNLSKGLYVVRVGNLSSKIMM